MAVPWEIFRQTSASDANAPSTPGLSPTGTNTYYSAMWSGRLADGFSLSVFTSGTLTGTFTLWVTDKPVPGLADDTDWIQDSGFSPTNPAGSAVKFTDEASNSKAYHKRLKYVQTSGSGTINAWVTAPKTA